MKDDLERTIEWALRSVGYLFKPRKRGDPDTGYKIAASKAAEAIDSKFKVEKKPSSSGWHSVGWRKNE